MSPHHSNELETLESDISALQDEIDTLSSDDPRYEELLSRKSYLEDKRDQLLEAADSVIH